MDKNFKLPVPKHHPDYSRLLALAHHRHRVRTARYEVECWNFVNGSLFRICRGKMKRDWERNFSKVLDDMYLLSMLKKADLLGGVVKTFPDQLIPEKTCKLFQLKCLDAIETENRYIGRRMLNVKAEVHSFNPMYAKKTTKPVFVVPERFRNKCKECNIEMPTDCGFIQFFLFPKIYMDIEIRNLMSFGRVEIQLYTEAAPALVRDIVKICDEKQLDRIKIIRMFLDLWIVFDVTLPADAASIEAFDIDKSILSNMNHVGILSFAESSNEGLEEGFREGFEDGRFNFTMTVRPIKVLNEKRVPFGRVVTNLAMLEQIQDFGTPKGKPKKRIIMKDCGLV